MGMRSARGGCEYAIRTRSANVRPSLGYGRRFLLPYARGHRSGAGECTDWCCHDAWNQKPKIRSYEASGALLAERRRLLVTEAVLGR